MMDKVQYPFFSEPGEALQRRFDQVIMLVQVQVPAERKKYTGKVSEHDQGTEVEIDECREDNNGNAVVVEGMRLTVLEFLDLQPVCRV